MIGRTNAGGVDTDPYKRQIADLTNQNNDLRNQVNNLNTQNGNLQNQVNDLNEQLSSLTGGSPNLEVNTSTRNTSGIGSGSITTANAEITSSGTVFRIWNINLSGNNEYPNETRAVQVNGNNIISGNISFSDNVFNIPASSTKNVICKSNQYNGYGSSSGAFNSSCSYYAYVGGSISKIDFNVGLRPSDGAGQSGDCDSYIIIHNTGNRYHNLKIKNVKTGVSGGVPNKFGTGSLYLGDSKIDDWAGSISSSGKTEYDYDVSNMGTITVHFSAHFRSATTSYATVEAYATGTIELS